MVDETKKTNERTPAPTPRYAIGDKAFVADYGTAEERVVCPDCGGTKKVKVVLASGEELEARCQHCSVGFESTGYVTVTRYAPRVWKGTVGSVKIDTNDERPVSYMLRETGVGTGRIHYEDRLFDSAPEAEAVAARAAKRQEEHIRKHNEERNARRRLSDLRYRDRWERHSKALCDAARELAEYCGAVEPATANQPCAPLRRKVLKLLGWIKPEEY
jgi:hypothetical protein